MFSRPPSIWNTFNIGIHSIHQASFQVYLVLGGPLFEPKPGWSIKVMYPLQTILCSGNRSPKKHRAGGWVIEIDITKFEAFSEVLGRILLSQTRHGTMSLAPISLMISGESIQCNRLKRLLSTIATVKQVNKSEGKAHLYRTYRLNSWEI